MTIGRDCPGVVVDHRPQLDLILVGKHGDDDPARGQTLWLLGFRAAIVLAHGERTAGLSGVSRSEADFWSPSWWGRTFSGGGSWSLQVHPDLLSAEVSGLAHAVGPVVVQAAALTVRPGRVWSTVVVDCADASPGELMGLPNRQGKILAGVLDHCRHLVALRSAFQGGLRAAAAWSNAVDAEVREWEHRWWPRELIQRWQRTRPTLASNFFAARDDADLQMYVQAQPDHVHRTLARWDEDLPARAATRNERFLAEEADRRREFFATVESSPLTGEQVRAVVCFDNRVQVVAAAGSGKTSTIVARAAYAVRYGLVLPERILMLAFNKQAAQELQERVHRRLGTLGDRTQVTASTFHAFGLRVLGEASGRKPRVARGLGDGEGDGQTRLEQVVDALRDQDLQFRMQWDLFRLVFGRPLADFGEVEDLEAWDRDSGQQGFRTLGGEVVKSREELMLANWLSYNGVRYEYERDYPHDTADAEHGRYRPDFYYPDIDTYHEHWALNRDGQPPPEFAGYLEGVRWKRSTHAQFGTTLLETTSATVRDGTAFDHLARELTARGVVLDPNPDRDVIGEQPLKYEQLLAVMRTFLAHCKSNRLTEQQVRDRVSLVPGDRLRAELFVALFLPVLDEWDRRLRQANEVDFEDMINRAADLIEAKTWASPYDLIMVDEMQDSSHARSRLVHALVDAPGRYLFSVGDDWQSINRFAGSDLTVMTRFNEWFGPSQTLKLERTFRSPQSICDISSQFVGKNPEQLTKRVRSAQPEFVPALQAIAVDTDDQYASVIIRHLRSLDVPASQPADRPLRVSILGRYNNGRAKVQAVMNRQWTHLQVGYSTIHSAKGKEADYVIIIDVTAGGLPSAIEDDPLLALAMPAAERYPHAEERRLFYVALTRTRRSVLLLTLTRRESPFLLELINDGHVTLTSAAGEPISVTPCPTCKQGRMTRRTNRKTGIDFLGCNRFPRFKHTSNIRAGSTGS